MPQRPAMSDDTVRHEPVPDETVRMRADGPAPDGGPQLPAGAADDTRPVTRDWLLGAPDADRVATPVAPDDDWSTEAFDRDTTDDSATTAEPQDDATAALGALPAEHDGRDDGRDDGTDTPAGPPPGGEPPADGPRAPWWRRRAVLAPAGVVAVLAALYGVDLLVASGDIPRSTVVAGVDIGGLSPAAAASTLEEELTPRVQADHTVVTDDVESTLSPATAGITLDIAGTVDAADDLPLNPWTRLVTLFSDREVDPVITSEETALSAQIETIAAQVDRVPVDATISIDGTTPSVVDPADGRALDREGAAEAITAALASGGDPSTPIELPVDVAKVHVDRAEAQRVLDETVTPALSAPVGIEGSDGTSAEVPVAAIAASLTFTPQEDGKLVVTIDPAALQTALGEELKVFGSGAEDARFELSGGAVTVVPSVDGIGIAPDHLAEQLMTVLTQSAPRTLNAELGPIPADFTTEEAQALGVKEEIGSFTTNIGNAQSGINIRVVAEEVDGALVMPGETFSLNTFTGPRGTAQGYVPAGVISGGKFTTAVGGGISQFATTMFNAVFFSGLEDVYHKPHSYYISRYPAGREATVYEGQIDLQWKNDSDTGVYVDTAWTPGTLTVTFYGTKRYDIESISGNRVNVREPAVQEKADDGECHPQAGAQGFDITVTRVFKDLDSGAEIKRENFQTHYAAEPIIRCVPPAPGAPAPAGSAPAGTAGTGGRRPTDRPFVRRPARRAA
ncbi:MAG: putative vancomycin resistance protein [Blastococcus sp.]|nr:putative vancomycin resistance protein [Blastococcus sp.]